MDIRSFDDIQKLHENFSEQLAARMQTLATSETSGAVDPIGERRAQLEAAEEKVNAIQSARDAAMKRFDDELARHSARAEGLKRELDEIESARLDAERAAAGDESKTGEPPGGAAEPAPAPDGAAPSKPVRPRKPK